MRDGADRVVEEEKGEGGGETLCARLSSALNIARQDSKSALRVS
jgi:hypothetical protein